jgi:hypothetical protein
LHLLVLFLDYGNIFLLRACLLPELLGVLLGALLVLSADLFSLGLGLACDLSDLGPQMTVLNTGGFSLLLEPPLVSLKLSHQFYVISHNLVVKDLLLLELRHETLDFICHLKETLSLVFFVGGFSISQIH